MIQLNPAPYEAIRPLLLHMDIHLVVRSILARQTPAKIFVDDANQPKALFAQAGHRYILAGDPTLDQFNEDVQEQFAETIYPAAQAEGLEMFGLYYDDPAWEQKMDILLKEKYPLHVAREYFACRELRHNWRNFLPNGFEIRMVDAELLAEDHLGHLDRLKEEMTSERPSVDDFLAKSFGVCAVYEGQLAGWCLSEYNADHRCEVGIETIQEFRKRGLATALTLAFLEYAFSHNIHEVGWHCFRRNVPSSNTARKAGFERVCDYPAYLGWFDEGLSLTINGNEFFDDEDYQQAMSFYDKAIDRTTANRWTYWNAARASSMLGKTDDALAYLEKAIENGFDDMQCIQESEHLINLHQLSEWDVLTKRA